MYKIEALGSDLLLKPKATKMRFGSFLFFAVATK
jgi:hypothetical protein